MASAKTNGSTQRSSTQARRASASRSLPPQDALPKNALPKNALPKNALPKNALPKDALPKDAPPEALAFPAQHLPGLPVATRFNLQCAGIPWEIVWTSEPNPDTRLGIVFDGAEVEALAIAAQSERLWPADMKAFCLRKLQDRSFRVTLGLALGGAQTSAGPAWSLARVLRWLDLKLAGIEFATAGTAPRSKPRAA